MNDDGQLRRELLDRIKVKKSEVSAFARAISASGDRQTNTAIICGAIAAVLTAGPALGGTGLTVGVARTLALSTESIVWQTLCFAATIFSLVATISTNLYKSHDVAARLSKTEACSAELEGLEALVEIGQLPVNDGVKLYQQYIAQVPFLAEKS